MSKRISSTEAFYSGMIMGALLQNRACLLTPQPVMDGDAYTNQMILVDAEGVAKVNIMVTEVHKVAFGVSNSARCSCGESFHAAMAEDLDELVDAHVEGREPNFDET